VDWSVTLAIATFAVFAAIMWIVDRREARQRRQSAESLARRPARSAEEIAGIALCGVAPDVSERVLRIVAEVSEFSLSPPKVSIEPSRLRGSDTLHEDLGYHFDSLAFCELHLRLEKEFGIDLRINDSTAPPTVGDIVRIIGEHVTRTAPHQ
jgi:acyl carrier protein